MNFITHLRTSAATAGAFTLCCGLITQMLARALGYASELGPALVKLGDFRLYSPFSFLAWALAWAPAAPSLLVLALCLALVCAFAAYAVAIIVAKLQPIVLAPDSPWRDLASYRELGHCELLRDEGLALGAVRRHAWARHRIVRLAHGGCLFLGESSHTDDALRAALASWPGALVLIDGRGDIAERMGRKDVVRFTLGRSDTLCINPMLTLRTGLHAWTDARRLARNQLAANPTCCNEQMIDALALLILDHLLCAPPEARNLAALRPRLIDAAILVSELCDRWAKTPQVDSAPALWEMARVARALIADPDQAIASYKRIDAAFAGFADAELARATSAHHLNLAQFVSARPSRTLVLSMQASSAHAGPIMRSVVAQIGALHASTSDAPALLIAVEADAARLLAEPHAAPLTFPVNSNTRLILQTADIAHAKGLCGAHEGLSAIVAIGPQSKSNAAALSQLGGRCRTYDPIPHHLPRWRRHLFPTWVARETERLPIAALTSADASEAFLIVSSQKPARLEVLIGGGVSTFADISALAAHDWSAPPLDITSAPPDARARPGFGTPLTPPARTKLRRILTRTAAPPAPQQGHPP